MLFHEIWINRANITEQKKKIYTHKKVNVIRFYLHKVQKQAKRIHNVESRIVVNFWKVLMAEKDRVGLLEKRHDSVS